MIKIEPSYSYDDLIESGNNSLFGEGNAKLPLPPMLMMDRIERIADTGGAYDKGEIIAHLDIDPSLWFFACHFAGDPVMPGCLGLDAMWQLVGFWLGWTGGEGRGRALVHERMGDAKAAYYDLKRAVELEPDWEQARDSLSRFTVTKAG